MSKWNSWENQFLQHIFLNVNPSYAVGGTSGIEGSATAGNLYIALFTADPGETGSIANEAAYTGYARVAVSRDSSGWTVTNNVASNTAAITFGTCTASPGSPITHFGICKAGTSGVADLIFYGAFSASLTVIVGTTPQVSAGSITVTED